MSHVWYNGMYKMFLELFLLKKLYVTIKWNQTHSMWLFCKSLSINVLFKVLKPKKMRKYKWWFGYKCVII